jgi:vacuolar protein sorting-associated protein 13A/C
VPWDLSKGSEKESLGSFDFILCNLLSVGVKPVVGVADFVARTSEGIRNTTTMGEKEKQRSRPPRVMGADGTLTVLSTYE